MQLLFESVGGSKAFVGSWLSCALIQTPAGSSTLLHRHTAKPAVPCVVHATCIQPPQQPQLPRQPQEQQPHQPLQQPPQQQPQQPPPQQQRVQLTPGLAARLIAAAAAAGRPAATLTLQDITVISVAWLPLLPPTLGECNRLLSARMKATLASDPLAFELIKQDGKDFM